MAATKAPLRVIHCHGCRKGVLVQFTSHCPRCGQVNTTLQTIHDDECHACGERVTDYTAAAIAHMQRERAEAS